MKKLLGIMGVAVFFVLILFTLSFSQQSERITITTYYPSPYGSYRELTVSESLRLETDSRNPAIDGPQIEWRTGTARHWNIDQWADRLRFYTEDINNGTGQERVTILENGNVGIGTDNPTARLHLRGRTATDAVFFIQPGEWDSAGDYGEIRFGDSNHYIRGEHTNGTTFYDLNKFQFLGGNVGIGTTNTWSRLHISQNTENPTVLILQNEAPATIKDAAINFILSNTQTVSAGITAHRYDAPAGVPAGLLFFTREFGAAGRIYERVRITPDGNVGIGTTNPVAKLDVGGGIKFQSGNRYPKYIGPGDGGYIWCRCPEGCYLSAVRFDTKGVNNEGNAGCECRAFRSGDTCPPALEQ
jgi:hypothetical protein